MADGTGVEDAETVDAGSGSARLNSAGLNSAGFEGVALDDPRLAAVAVVFQAQAALACRFHKVHDRYGLSTMDFDTLLRLARAPGHQLRMSDLATQLSMSTSGITRVAPADLAAMLDGLRAVRDAAHPAGMARNDFDGCLRPSRS